MQLHGSVCELKAWQIWLRTSQFKYNPSGVLVSWSISLRWQRRFDFLPRIWPSFNYRVGGSLLREIYTYAHGQCLFVHLFIVCSLVGWRCLMEIESYRLLSRNVRLVRAQNRLKARRALGERCFLWCWCCRNIHVFKVGTGSTLKTLGVGAV